jgi:hypothetical protein
MGTKKTAHDCNFEGSTGFTDGLNLTSYNATGANFRGTTVSSDFKNTNLTDTCLVDADFTLASFGTNVNTSGAIFCRTKRPGGAIDNTGCDSGTRCCPTCIENGNACGPTIGGACCSGCCSGGLCRDTQTDPDSCGVCGLQCAEGADCIGGECVIVVRPADMHGWQFYNDQADVPIGPTFESGPGNPPRGDGSALLKIGGSAEGKILSARIFRGTQIADFARLEYTTWVKPDIDGITGPSLQLGIDRDSVDGNTLDPFQGRLVFVPSQSALQPIATNTWQSWDVIDPAHGAAWGLTKDFNNPTDLRCRLGTQWCTLTQVLGHFPDIRIHPIGPSPVNPGAGLGIIGFKVGSGEGIVDANVDSLAIKLDGPNQPTTIYDFEPNS